MPAAALSARVLRAAAPLLAHHARQAVRLAVARAVGVLVLVLPAVVAVDVAVGRAAFALLTAVLPTTLGFYVVFAWAATLSLLFALTGAAIPILAERQARLAYAESP